MLNRLNLYTILFAYSWGVQKSLLYFCNPNGLRVMCVCLLCGRRKQKPCTVYAYAQVTAGLKLYLG